MCRDIVEQQDGEESGSERYCACDGCAPPPHSAVSDRFVLQRAAAPWYVDERGMGVWRAREPADEDGRAKRGGQRIARSRPERNDDVFGQTRSGCHAPRRMYLARGCDASIWGGQLPVRAMAGASLEG